MCTFPGGISTVGMAAEGHFLPLASSSVTLAVSLSLVLVTTMPRLACVDVDHRFTGKKLQPTLPRDTRSHGDLQKPSLQVSPAARSQSLWRFQIMPSHCSMVSWLAEQRTFPASHMSGGMARS